MAHASPVESPYTADGLPDVAHCRINLLAAHRKGAFKKPEDEPAGTAELQLSDTAPKLLRYKPDSSPALVLLPTLKQPESNQYNTLRSKQMQKSLDDPAGNHQAVALLFDVMDEPQYDWALTRQMKAQVEAGELTNAEALEILLSKGFEELSTWHEPASWSQFQPDYEKILFWRWPSGTLQALSSLPAPRALHGDLARRPLLHGWTRNIFVNSSTGAHGVH